MQDLRTLFESEYPGKESLFESLIKPIFSKAKDTSLTDKQVLADSDQKQIKSFCIIAQVRGGFPIVFADVELQDTVALKRSRVNIQNCVRKVMENDSNAIIFFHFTDNAKEWRVSYVHRAETNKNSTSAKRYTYLCGPEHSCRTVSERFATLKGLATIKDEDMIEAFSLEALTEEFYKELFAWYEWAREYVKYPFGVDKKVELVDYKQNEKLISTHIIRLITRLIFVWFIKQKDLVPKELFDKDCLARILNGFDDKRFNSIKDGTYYNAILQNLFFATLNNQIGKRMFAEKGENYTQHFGIKTLFRDDKKDSYFKISHEEFIELFSKIPYLNGGLFECLDHFDENVENHNHQIYVDGFSAENGRKAFVPNALFFDEKKGVIPILKAYNFTVEESTPSDIQVALDPELLGKVFENLLGAYNPETQESARKDSGSFYTPREIVEYMVNESLKSYLMNDSSLDNKMIQDLLYGKEDFDLKEKESQKIIERLLSIKVLDPACGSGAFPMGMLSRLVEIIRALDKGISPYELKLKLIQNCIYGVDIQPIAVQISKLRFFISLICEQEKTSNADENYGINTLPNLETKIVCANSLIGVNRNKETHGLFHNDEIDKLEKELLEVRNKHIFAKNIKEKFNLRQEDRKLSKRLIELLKKENEFGEANDSAEMLAKWNPYDQNTQSPFFDAEWMFGIKTCNVENKRSSICNDANRGGFDIIIGNPPYVQVKKGVVSKNLYPYSEGKDVGKQNLYKLFIEASYNLLKENGLSTLIVQSSLMCDMSSSFTRELLLTKTKIQKLIEFPKIAPHNGGRVFKSVLQGTCISIFIKSYPNSDTKFKISINNDISTINSLIFENVNQFELKKYFSARYEIPLIMKGEMSIIKKVKSHQKLKTIIADSLQGNINTIYLSKIKSDEKTNIFIAKGANVHKYFIDDEVFYGKQTKQVKELVERNFNAGAVLVTQNITGTTDAYRIHAAYAECKNTKFVFLHSVNILYLPNPSLAKFILAILNSKLSDWLFRKTSTNNHCNMYELIDLPIPTVNKSQQQLIIALVDKIICAKKTDRMSDTSKLEAEINKLVYQLYELDEEEIRIVERK